MNYSKSSLLYQDKPEYGFILKLILVIVPVALLVGSIYLLLSGESTDAPILIIEACVAGLIFWSIFPRSYRVYEDHLRIVLGGPFSIKVGFANIKSIEFTSRLTFSANFVTKFARNCVVITKKRGLSIAITPKDSDSFIENTNEALSQWMKTQANKS